MKASEEEEPEGRELRAEDEAAIAGEGRRPPRAAEFPVCTSRENQRSDQELRQRQTRTNKYSIIFIQGSMILHQTPYSVL